MKDFCVTCPHCKEPVLIEKLQCGIFRHGVVIKTKKQISPHATKQKCDELVQNKLIYGCGKPFQIKCSGKIMNAYACDYI
jgi:hypothetical protein